MRLGLAMLAILIFHRAVAMTVNFMPFSDGVHSFVEWQGPICHEETVPALSSAHLVIVVESDGGYIIDEFHLEDQLRSLAITYGENHSYKLKLLFGTCRSACVNLLASANKLAKEGLIDLAVMKDYDISIHGAHDASGIEDSEGTILYVENLIRNGANPNWIKSNKNYFQLIGDQYKELPYGSNELNKFGVTSAAALEDPQKYLALKLQFVAKVAKDANSFSEDIWDHATHAIKTNSGKCPE